MKKRVSNFLKKLTSWLKKHIPMNVDDAADLLERQITKINLQSKVLQATEEHAEGMELTFQVSKVRFLIRQKLLKVSLTRKKLLLRKKL